MDSIFTKVLSGFGACCLLATPAICPAHDVIYDEDFDCQSGSEMPDWISLTSSSSDDLWIVENHQLKTGPVNDLDSNERNWFLLQTAESAGWDNYQASVDFKMEQNLGAVLLAFCWTDEQNYYFAELQVVEIPGRTEPLKIASIAKRVDGREIIIASEYSDSSSSEDFPDLHNGSMHELEIIANQSNLSLSIDGNMITQARDTEFSQGSVAVGILSGSATFDDLSIEENEHNTPPIKFLSSTEGHYRVPLMKGVTAAIAEAGFNDLVHAGYSIYAVKEEVAPDRFDVYLGPFPTIEQAEKAQKSLFNDSFAVNAPEFYQPDHVKKDLSKDQQMKLPNGVSLPKES